MRKMGPDALRNLPVAGTLLAVVAIAALGLAYWSNVTSRERYLQSRNFRLLADVAEQVQAIVNDTERVLRSSFTSLSCRFDDDTAGIPPGQTLDAATAAQWERVQKCLLQGKRPPRERVDGTAQARRTVPVEFWRGEVSIQQSAARVGEVAQELNQYRTKVLGIGSDLHVDWSPPEARLPQVSYQVAASALFSGAFDAARWERAFSTMALATTDGRILFAVGPQAAEVKASSIAALLPASTDKDGANLMRFATAVSSERVRIAGIDYWMYAQPCCRGEGFTPPVSSSTPGLVVIGLADADALRSLSLAISPILVLGGGAFVMSCLVGWAFLKCSLMGVHQRLGRHDVVNLLASGTFGVALTTVLLLTTAAYARLSADVDSQLKQLAAATHDKLLDELQRAGAQLAQMVDVVRTDRCLDSAPTSPPVPGRWPTDPCQPAVDAWSKGKDHHRALYRGFIAFAMVDESGIQAVKTASSAAARTIVDVNPRAYYQRAKTHEQLWSVPQPADPAMPRPCPNGCYLEYLSSWNTGRPQVVISMPTGIDRLPVATLSIPMDAFLAPVLPPDFEFAVVDAAGSVQFHSDPQRNGLENLLLETDQNPRLRSLVAAHGAGTFNTMYWGYPYRGYVQPAVLPGWSIVVLHGKQTTRALVLEWFIVAMLLTALYTLGWVVVMVLAIGRGAGWLWPDPLRRHWYVPIGCVALAAAATWLVIAWRQPVGVTVLAGILIPLLTWAVAYGVLAVRPAGAGEVRQWTELCRGYRFAGSVLFLLTAAVPAASFYALSYDRYIEAFVKERQIGLARRINAVVACRPGEELAPHPARYDNPAHDGEVRCVRSTDDREEDQAIVTYLHEAFEDSIPYFTSASVALRELMHHKSDDDTWFSRRNGDGVLELQMRAAHPEVRLQVSTTLPAIVGWRGSFEGAGVVLISVVSLLMLIAVGAAAYAVISFLLRRVLLADVVEPIRRRLRIVTQVGQHLQVICLDPSWMADRVNDLYPLRVTPAASGANGKTLADIRREVSEAPASQRVAIADLEEASDDAQLLEKKLEIVEAVMDLPNQTVLLFTRRTARELDAWVQERSGASPDGPRWSKLIGRLRVTELPVRSSTSGAERWKQHWRTLLQGWREEFISRWQDWRAPLRWRARLLETEGQSDPKIDEIATELQKSPAFVSGSLTRDQILEEIEESADQHYREIWEGRTDDERVLLEHVARHGLASAASRRVVRQLLAAGLLRKDPELRLMSESFRRFVLEPERRLEVAVLEQQAAPSVWDRLRVPLAMSGMLSLLFLVVTQREALDTTVSMALGVTTAVPTLVKLTSLLAQLGVRGGDAKGNG